MPKIPLSSLLSAALSVGLVSASASAQVPLGVPAPGALPPLPAAPTQPASSPAPPPPPTSSLPQLPADGPAPAAAPPGAPAPPAVAAPSTEPVKPAPLEATQPKDGFGLVSPDGAFSLKIKGLVQADSRFFFAGGTNQFLIRRARPTLEGTLYKYFEYRLTAELAASPSLLDVWANVKLIKELQFRAGKFKTPLGLERLQNDPEMPFIERGLPSDLVADRDVGVMVHGDLIDGTIAYALGVFNGAEDGRNIDGDTSDKKDIVGRLFVRPFVPVKIDALKNFGLGVAASRGTHTEALPSYVSPSQIAFFSYRAGAAAAGTHRRLAPQAYFYFGPVGVLGEYTSSTQIVASAASPATAITNTAWQVELSGYLTGEKASFAMVSPKAPFDPAKGGFGAIELAFRVGQLKIDDAVFDLNFANRDTAARTAKEMAVGVNWHMARGYKLDFNYEMTTFEGGGGPGADRPTETALLTRLQAVF